MVDFFVVGYVSDARITRFLLLCRRAFLITFYIVSHFLSTHQCLLFLFFFPSPSSPLSRGAQGALLVYDVTRRDSYEHVQKWFDRAKQLGGEHLQTVLVGNKIDLPAHERQVSTQEGEALALELGVPFIETSALSGSNVENAFVRMTQAIKRSLDKRGLTGVKPGNLTLAGGVQLASKERGMSLGDQCGCVIS